MSTRERIAGCETLAEEIEAIVVVALSQQDRFARGGPEVAVEPDSAKVARSILTLLTEEPVWQPIETAPKGQHILYFPERTGRNALSHMVRVEHFPIAFLRQPTHWMPLPAIPETRDETT